jgi:sugar O-acyltransferase (sialic acid O-acetyltransferase NeuD family)
MDRIVVVGGGGHAKVVISVLSKLHYQILGYTDLRAQGVILGVPYLGRDDTLLDLIHADEQCRAVLGVGKTDTSATRIQLQDAVRALGFQFPFIVSPAAVKNEGVELGEGTVVFDGAVINSGAVVGSACILNSNCTVEHDCRLGDNVHIAPGASVGGGVIIGSNCMIGMGANVIQGVKICGGCLIGAGSTVVDDIAVAGTYLGVPACLRV